MLHTVCFVASISIEVTSALVTDFQKTFLYPWKGRFYEINLVNIVSVPTSVTNFSRICSLVFSKILHSNKNLEIGKSDRSKFSRTIIVCPNMGKSPKWRFLSFHQILLLLLIPWKWMIPYGNLILRKVKRQ